MFALIVAIDQYKSQNISNLSGCENDGNAIVDFLKDKFPAPHITCLYNEQATRECIINTFRFTFKENTAIQPGDPMLFFYAGHGSRVPAPTEWSPAYRNIETICPHDEETTNLSNDYIHGIPDYTIDSLLCELEKEKGNNITLIFDSCHSGGIMRIKGTKRCKTTDKPIPVMLDASTLLSTRGPKTTVFPERPFKSMGSAVLLAACEDDGIAYEHYDEDGACMGAFTRCLIPLLRHTSFRQFTYSSLLYHLEDIPSQHPRCEGKHQNRFLFHHSDPAVSNVFNVSRIGDIYRVEAGTCSGVVRNKTEFAIYEGEVTHNNKRGIVVALEASPEYCTAKLASGQHPDDIRLARVTVLNWNNGALRLKVHFLETALGLLQPCAALDEYIWQVGRQEGQLVVGSPDGKKLEIERLDELTSSYADKILPGIEPLHLERALKAASHFNFHLYHSAEPFGEQDVVIELRLLKRQPSTKDSFNQDGSNRWPVYAPDPSGTNLFEGTSKVEVVALKDKFYGLTLKNNSPFDLFPCVFYFDPSDYSIEVNTKFPPTLLLDGVTDGLTQKLYHPPRSSEKGPLKKAQSDSSEFAIGYGPSVTEAIKFSLDKKVESETGFLKFFFSTKYVDLEGIEQKSFRLPRRPKLVSTLPDGALWHSRVFILTTVKDKSID